MESLTSLLKRQQRRIGLRPRAFGLVSGPPRSGTTAVVRWLKEQAGVNVMSESRILLAAHRFLEEVNRMRHLSQSTSALEQAMARLVFGYYAKFFWLVGRSTVIDKEPLGPIEFPQDDMYAFLQNVHAIAPQTRMLLMIRDPVATIWSAQARAWGYSLTKGAPVTYSLEEAVEHWRQAAQAVGTHADRENTIICHFDALVRDPTTESDRILKLFGIEDGHAFEPRPTKDVGFSPEERQLILDRTAPERQLLDLT